MKYTNRADLLGAAAKSIRMQEAAGIKPVYKNLYGIVLLLEEAPLFTNLELNLPVAIVEGKPVFVGDELWTPCSGKQRVAERYPETLKFADGSYELPSKCSWNPPKPKTVKMLAYYSDGYLFWRVEGQEALGKKEYRVPSEDKVIELK